MKKAGPALDEESGGRTGTGTAATTYSRQNPASPTIANAQVNVEKNTAAAKDDKVAVSSEMKTVQDFADGIDNLIVVDARGSVIIKGDEIKALVKEFMQNVKGQSAERLRELVIQALEVKLRGKSELMKSTIQNQVLNCLKG